MIRLRLIFLLLLSVTLKQVYGVWPLPQSITQSNERYVLNPHLFTYNHAKDSAARAGCSVLDAAFKRYFRIVFPDFADRTGWWLSHNILFLVDLLPKIYLLHLLDKSQADIGRLQAYCIGLFVCTPFTIIFARDQDSGTIGLSPNLSQYQWVSEVVDVMNTLMKVQMKVVSM